MVDKIIALFQIHPSRFTFSIQFVDVTEICQILLQLQMEFVKFSSQISSMLAFRSWMTEGEILFTGSFVSLVVMLTSYVNTENTFINLMPYVSLSVNWEE